ncbi:MAG: hypothetical protein P4N59_07480 [Negativicutes bacterium]|nr:hypothetical protein [Negativicutes bacterium]
MELTKEMLVSIIRDQVSQSMKDHTDNQEKINRETLQTCTRMETLLQGIVNTCPRCQTRLGGHDVALATVEASAKSAHHRIDGVYTSAGAAGAIAAIFIQFIEFVWNNLQKGGTHGP